MCDKMASLFLKSVMATHPMSVVMFMVAQNSQNPFVFLIYDPKATTSILVLLTLAALILNLFRDFQCSFDPDPEHIWGFITTNCHIIFIQN